MDVFKRSEHILILPRVKCQEEFLICNISADDNRVVQLHLYIKEGK